MPKKIQRPRSDWSVPDTHAFYRLLAVVAAVGGSATAHAEDFKLGESPLSVIMKWRPTSPDPEVKEFVRASRPAPDDLKYTSVAAPKIERPALKSKKELKAMTDGLDGRAQALHARGAPVAGAGNGTAQRLQAAAVENRRRATEAFGATR